MQGGEKVDLLIAACILIDAAVLGWPFFYGVVKSDICPNSKMGPSIGERLKKGKLVSGEYALKMGDTYTGTFKTDI